MSEERSLRVRIDGELLAEEPARDFWKRFSAHMEANKGDLAGFAANEGLASVRPAFEDGAALLIGSRSEAQVPYTNVTPTEPNDSGKRPDRSTAGSPKNQSRDRRPAKKR